MTRVGPNDGGSGDPRGRIVVTGGGDPTAEQIAAVVIALAPTTVETVAAGPAPWHHAALLEGIGSPNVPAPADLGQLAAGH